MEWQRAKRVPTFVEPQLRAEDAAMMTHLEVITNGIQKLFLATGIAKTHDGAHVQKHWNAMAEIKRQQAMAKAYSEAEMYEALNRMVDDQVGSACRTAGPGVPVWSEAGKSGATQRRGHDREKMERMRPITVVHNIGRLTADV